ncbi:uncharacterized protein PV09_01516 [Verruconis gallopava]|uniref:OPA3-like protein n=1 Tax=Verruconis gallopava TaxID=253628 RepID=A0A0D2AM76_9PEZI|nr:uncharacterized protein PV09_01516 [Verruconis gallopava]KIW07560.1 hypothetical protein PV09_01516 [Verruconis gallopava]
MSLTFKLGSLAIRTLAKPLSNYIKRNAMQHENFRRLCVGFAQRLHRVDMRLRIGLLQDPAAIERQIQREVKEAEKRRLKDAIPTVKTEAETLAEEAAKSKERKEAEEYVKATLKAPRIRPLSENKAIETGANFIAEAFLFLVAGGLILAESWRRDRKEKKQDAEVNDALLIAEREREEMKQKLELLQAEIEALMDNKRPFDSVRAAAVASIRQIPSTHHTSTKSVSSETGVNGNEKSASGAAGATASHAPPAESQSIPSSPAKPSDSTKMARDASNEPSLTRSSWLPSWLGGSNSKPSSS